MIEQGIYFALGCVITALAALMFAPVFWNRALRLTRQRLQLQIPGSMQEIYAERDQLRAEFAVERLRLEQSSRRVQAGKDHDMAEIGRQTMEASRATEERDAARRSEQAHEEAAATLREQLDKRDAEVAELRAKIEAESSPSVAVADGSTSPSNSDSGRAPAVDPARNLLALDDAQRRVRALEQEVSALQAALEAAREREKSAYLQNSLRAEKSRLSDRVTTDRIERLQAENTALQGALAAVHNAPADGATADGGLRDSIHALGLAVAAMTREAKENGTEPASKQNADVY